MLAYRRKSCNTREHLFMVGQSGTLLVDQTFSTRGGQWWPTFGGHRPRAIHHLRAGSTVRVGERVAPSGPQRHPQLLRGPIGHAARARACLRVPRRKKEVPLTLMRRSGSIPANWDPFWRREGHMNGNPRCSSARRLRDSLPHPRVGCSISSGRPGRPYSTTARETTRRDHPGLGHRAKGGSFSFSPASR